MELYEKCKYITDIKNEEEKIKLNKFIYKLFLILILYSDLINLIIKNHIYYKEDIFLKDIDNYKDNNFMGFNKDSLFEYLNESEYFRITFIKYSFSFKHKIIKMEYNIGFYDVNNNLILPPNLA